LILAILIVVGVGVSAGLIYSLSDSKSQSEIDNAFVSPNKLDTDKVDNSFVMENVSVDDESTELLFVQTANSGTFIQKDGRNILTLYEASPSTVWFSDRPDRITGSEATDLFVAKWDEGKNSFAIDPPNAALDILDGTLDADVFIMELTNPVYSPDHEVLQYDVIILEDAPKGLSHYSNDMDATIPSTFSNAALFIDNADSSLPIPGISQFYGVDITKGLFSKAVPLALFDFKDDDTFQVQLGNNTFDVPESLVFDGTDYYTEKTEVFTSIKDLSTHLSVDAGVSYKSPTVDAEVDVSYSQDTSTSSTSYFATIDHFDRKYRLTAETGLEGTDRFQNAVDNLPSDYNADSQDDYYEFFGTFGTHYTDYVEFGGIMHFWSQESDTSSMSAEDFSAKVSGSVMDMDGGTTKATASSDVGTNKTSTESDVIISITGSGGDSSLLGAYLSERDTTSFNDWWYSINKNPGKIDTHYNEIFNLVTDPQKKTQLQNAMSDYLRSDFGYQIISTNAHQKFSTNISIGTDNSNTITFDLPSDDDTKVPFGGMMVVTSMQTGEIIETVTVNELPLDKNSSVTGKTIETLSDKIQSYEQKGDGYLYFISMLTSFDTEDQADFLWFEKIGADSFVNIETETNGNTYYILVGHSDLASGLGESMVWKANDDEWKVQSDNAIATGVPSDGAESQADMQRMAAYQSGFNGLDQLNCEFSGGISKTVNGFNGINSPIVDACS